MSFVIVNTKSEVAALPDGTLISWLPVMDDPSSEAVAFVRKIDHERGGDQGGATTYDVWISPGNGWEPEPLTSIVFPARIVLLGVPAPGDYVPPDYLDVGDVRDDQYDVDTTASTDGPAWLWSEQGALTTLATGGTYPRDVALQAASAITAQTTMTSTTVEKCTEVTLQLADAFAEWLIALPGQPAAISVDQIQADDGGHIVWQNNG